MEAGGRARTNRKCSGHLRSRPGPNLNTTVSGSVNRRTPVRLVLNGALKDYLADHYGESKLKVVARARNLDTNAHATARRTFRFHL